MRIGEIITELFDSQGVTWNSETMASFEVKGERFRCFFQRDAGGSNYYDFAFAHVDEENNETHGNTGLIGSASPRVFGTAIDCLVQFIIKKRPHSIGFIGKKADGRDVLYARMAPMIEKRMSMLGYTMKTKTMGRGPTFEGGLRITLYRDDSK